MNRPASPFARLRSALGKRLAPPAFVLFVCVLLAAALTGWNWFSLNLANAVVIGFDLAVLAFFAALLPLRRDRSADDMRRHAAETDANRIWVLGITIVVSLTLMLAMFAELPDARRGDALAKVVLLVTLALGWLFANVVYMLHYAHMHYGSAGNDKTIRGGFDFPGTPEPDYWDFLYFSLTAGMSFAASDVNVTSQAVRKVLVGHCLLSFVFNIGALAFCINVLAGSS